jgi:dTDP-4-amino-4,6-dideoxygalactose transaminase
MPKIPLVDLKANYARHKAGIDAAMKEVIDNTAFIQGPAVKEFEADFAAFSQAKYAVGVASGTAALHLAMIAAGVGPGDVVATPSHTFIATVEAITYTGATPRFIEIDPETGLMDPQELKKNIDGVKLVLPVHIHGRPVDLDAIGAICADAGIPLIEDAAQAQGSDYIKADGTKVRAGSYGLAGCFSFYPGKNLGAFGDAGAVTTNDEAFAKKVAQLRDHGRTSKYVHEILGFPERLDTLQAAVLKVKLTTLDADNERRREIAKLYSEKLAGVGDLRTPPETPNLISNYHHYVLRTGQRDALEAFLKDNGVGVVIHYPVPVHLQPSYADLGYKKGDMPITEAYADSIVSLPIFPELTNEQVDIVVAAVKKFYEQA